MTMPRPVPIKLLPTRRMCFLQWMACATLGLACAAGLSREALAVPPVDSVPRLDAQRYAGRWFEIARLPNRFQEDCLGDVTADYTLNADNSLTVVNRCRVGPTEWRAAQGRATRPPEQPTGARLKVNFLPRWMQWFPLGRGDYWVVQLDANYRYAVVSEPSREFIWILSRSPTLDEGTYRGIVERLQVAGYPVERLVRTPHQDLPKGFKDTAPRRPVGP